MKFVILCYFFHMKKGRCKRCLRFLTLLSKNEVKVLTFLGDEMTVIILKNMQFENRRGWMNKITKYQVRCILAQ